MRAGNADAEDDASVAGMAGEAAPAAARFAIAAQAIAAEAVAAELAVAAGAEAGSPREAGEAAGEKGGLPDQLLDVAAGGGDAGVGGGGRTPRAGRGRGRRAQR